ncbi:galactosylgalactosylxylosylprotein 3-beta-glucuronosyltransferase 1 [Tetranychus urticae]|uniref:Galactosylgalactosylxylosylprotein 3-beta-glucuronosyltransferase n=1 Tax=Tetranychus urticae TaxID=32264 RepID=T1JS18_TETUR|nr:galactosylgalactosylxylosylprotein 3-beta-glucuronosyltransferase 1 [Tetranychus urticae]
MKWTTLTSLVLLIPLLLLLVVLKETTFNQTTDNDDVGVYLASKRTIDDLANLIDPSQSCKCDCDKETASIVEAAAAAAAADSSTFSRTTILTTLPPGEDVPAETEAITSSSTNDQAKPPTIFVITPTYTRPTQMADMTRLAQTLMLVKNIFWIVTEDSHLLNQQVADLLNRTNIPHIQLLGPRPKTHLDKRSGRGVSNRLVALQWLRTTFANESNAQGVIYFADDDNAYDIKVFEEMRDTKKVSVWPVGLIAKIGLSTPILNLTTGKVVGFHDPFMGRRKFAVDMAGFAVNLNLFLSKPKAIMPYKVGYEEDYFIRSLGVTIDDLEPKANNCTQILVWHSKTQPGKDPEFVNLKKEISNSTNLVQLYTNVLRQ